MFQSSTVLSIMAGSHASRVDEPCRRAMNMARVGAYTAPVNTRRLLHVELSLSENEFLLA